MNDQATITPIVLRNNSSGVVLDTVVDEYLTPAGSCSYAINVHFDQIGAVTLRPGITQLGDQMEASKAVLGMYQSLDEGTGTADRLVAVVDDTLYYLVTATWTSKRTSLTAGLKARFTDFLDNLWMVNGTDSTAIWDRASGTSFVTTGSATDAPAGKFIDNFRSRVWIAATAANPSRLFYSSTPTAGAVSWTVATDYIDISPGDGQDITGIKKFAKILYVFKPDFVYPVYSINQTEPDPTIFTGTYSQESVIVAKDGMYWHHSSGIYRLSAGSGSPKEISRPIASLINSITRTNYDSVVAWKDEDHVSFFVGDVTVYGQTITNCTIRWTISTEVWTIYSEKNPIRAACSYDDGTSVSPLIGDSNGETFTYDSGATLDGNVINFQFETQWRNITGLRSETKTIKKIGVLHENAAGVKFGYKIDKDNFAQVRPLGSLEGNVNTIFEKELTGHRFKFNLAGSSSGSPFIYQGLEILDYLNQGVIE